MPRPVALLVTITAVGLLASGCGTTSRTFRVASIDDSSSPPGTSRLRPASAAMAASSWKATRCMRSHGVPNFPDPYMGHFGYSLDSGVDPNSAQFKAADAYCSKRYLFHTTVSPAQKARWNAAAVKYSACMRAHGAPDFPDPDGSGAIYFPTADYYRAPQVLRAEGACKSLFTGKGFVFVSPAP